MKGSSMSHNFSNTGTGENIFVTNSIDNTGLDGWAEFVSGHPNGSFFQTPEYYFICKNTPLFEPLVVTVKNNNKIVGLLLANIQKNFFNIFGKFTARSIVMGGPLIKNNDAEILNIVLRHYNNLVEKRIIYCQFRNFYRLSELEDVYTANGFKYLPHLNILVNFDKNRTELWNEVNQETKAGIEAAKQKGTKFIIENSFNALLRCYEIFTQVYSRIKLPLSSIDYFINMYHDLQKSRVKFLLFTAQYKKNIIGCLLAVGYNETLYGLYYGTKAGYSFKCPDDLLPWEIFKWAKDNGYKKFDWLGAGKPGIPSSIRDYKLKFGGEMTNPGRYERIYKPLLYRLGKYGLKIYPGLKNI